MARLSLLLVSMLVPWVSAEGQAFWPRFRGPNGQGVAETASPPTRLDAAAHLVWQAPVEPGLSSPVVWGEALTLTTHRTGMLSVVSFDRRDGRRRWDWSVPAGPTGDVHAASSPAAPTPACDARGVYAYFGSWGLVALGHDGRERWRRPLPPPRNRYGMASSPIVQGALVILVLDSDDLQSRIVAFAVEDGRTVWEAARAGQRATWSTPALWTGEDGREELIVFGALRLAGYDPRDGRELWSVGGFPQETVSVPVVGREWVFAGAAALGGRGGEQYDAMGWKQLLEFDANGDGRVQAEEVPETFRMVLRPDLPKEHPGYAVPFPFRRDFKNRDLDRDGALSEEEWNRSVVQWEASSRPALMAVRPGPGPGEGGAADRVVWKVARGLPEMPSLLHYRDRIYFVRDGGLLSCLEAGTGRFVYQERIGAAGQYVASPVAADGRLYLASASGTVTVVAAGGETPQVLAQTALDEPIHATPAPVERFLYVRTGSRILAFGPARGS